MIKTKEMMNNFKKTETFTPMDGAPHVFIRESREVAIRYSLEHLKVGKPVEFLRQHVDIGSLRTIAHRLEASGMQFSVTNPKQDNWSTALVCRTK